MHVSAYIFFPLGDLLSFHMHPTAVLNKNLSFEIQTIMVANPLIHKNEKHTHTHRGQDLDSIHDLLGFYDNLYTLLN